jgi:hypothetical protein
MKIVVIGGTGLIGSKLVTKPYYAATCSIPDALLFCRPVQSNLAI